MKIFVVKKGGNTATTVQSGVIAALIDSRERNVYFLNTRTKIFCIVGINREEAGIVWQKKASKKGAEQHPIPIKNPVSNKQHSLIFLTRKIQKSKKNAAHTKVRSADIFFNYDSGLK